MFRVVFVQAPFQTFQLIEGPYKMRENLYLVIFYLYFTITQAFQCKKINLASEADLVECLNFEHLHFVGQLVPRHIESIV